MKRALDVVVAFTLLVLLSPLIALIGLAILLTSGRPVFFVQRRPGRDARPFRLVKFRTMRLGGSVADDHLRLTRLGRVLRRTSLDELPELFNVLRGDMSLVGPRPLLMEYLPLYTPEQMRRHEVRPGITGLAQVEGRNALSWEEKFSWDVHYVDHQTLWLDLKILARTMGIVLSGRGIGSGGGETVEPFRGPTG